jgi:hypothetical protein
MRTCSLLPTMIALIGLAVTGSPLAAAPKASPQAAAPTPAPVALTFANDGTASTKGALHAPKQIDRVYTIALKQGDAWNVAVDDHKAWITYFNVFAPGAPMREGEGRTKLQGKAAADGVYTIRVFMTRSAVDKGAKSSYQLTVTRS